jgi:hypothetical protein
MIRWVLARMLALGHLLVTVMVVGLVVLTVGVEQAGVPWPELLRSFTFHTLLTVVWMGPLLCGLGTTFTLVRMEQRGELAALDCMGVGPSYLRSTVLLAGGFVGTMGFIISAVVLPDYAPSLSSDWLWTREGLWQTSAGVMIDLQAGGRLSDASLSVADLQRAEPRLAPWSVLNWAGTPGEQVELLSRLSRVLACVGFSALGLRAVSWRRPWVQLVGTGVVLLVLDLVGWTMCAQGRLPVLLGGSVGLWVWLFVALPQPSTRISRPV